MEKKEYKKPAMKEIELESIDIIASSEVGIDDNPNREGWS